MKNPFIIIINMIATGLAVMLFFSCDKEIETITTTTTEGCDDVASLVDINTRGACDETLEWDNSVMITESGDSRTITSNAIPGHNVGIFGGGSGSLNPNAISPQNDSYTLTLSPSKSASPTWLLDTNSGPSYDFGILINGVMLDP